MDLLAEYSASDDEDFVASAPSSVKVNVAPDVNTAGLTIINDEGKSIVLPISKTFQYMDPAKKVVHYNPKYEDMYAPIAGPAHPYSKDGLAAGQRNHKIGHVEDAHLGSFNFDEQYNTFHQYGYAAEPSGQGFVGDFERMKQHEGCTVYDAKKRKRDLSKQTPEASKAPGSEEKEKEEGDGEEKEEDEEDEFFGKETLNPSSDKWLLANKKSPWAGRVVEEKIAPENLTEEQKEYQQYLSGKRKDKRAGRGWADKNGEEARDDKSFFHGKEETNYKGDSWMDAPKDHKKENEHCYIPKKWVHTWSGHTKGVSKIQFFPGTGHLLLSASMDSKIKIWDVHNSGKCMRTYLGHSKAVKDVTFSNDGRKFVSCSYDNNLKLWDTETGQVLQTFTTGKTPCVVRFNPDDDKQNCLLAGFTDKKIVQWDMDAGEITQTYDQHLGAVNTITFCDENRRFITTSDDKSIRVWEFGIPVVMKYIAEPSMHSMPAITMHPNQNWFAAQSLDNQILVYSTKERFRLSQKKVFTGHTNGGYACQINFSPDGRFVISGDADGKLFFWDWKTHRVFRSFKAHDQVTIGCEWHPLEQSKVATCSWDGTIKYWD